MFRVLPRHMFGLVQSKMFPKYFLLGTILSAVVLLTFIIAHPFSEWQWQEKIQVRERDAVYVSYCSTQHCVHLWCEGCNRISDCTTFPNLIRIA